MPRTTPFSKVLEAREAFIRALASQTDAIRELRDWRLPIEASEGERERRLRELVAADSVPRCSRHTRTRSRIGCSV
jgi:hypothetical protein